MRQLFQETYPARQWLIYGAGIANQSREKICLGVWRSHIIWYNHYDTMCLEKLEIALTVNSMRVEIYLTRMVPRYFTMHVESYKFKVVENTSNTFTNVG